MDASKTFWCSFDVKSLFTNVPIQEAINICTEALFEDNGTSTVGISKQAFVELMMIATSSVAFSFDNIMYQQVDGVAMGSPLGPTLANVFLGYHERKILDGTDGPLFYRRYVDDTFVVFHNEEECDAFKVKLNSLHPSLQFTSEKEQGNRLNFLDVLVEKSHVNVTTDIYRKPTFSWVCMKWTSFSPRSMKIKLICTLVDRALKICSPSKLNLELERLRKLFLNNGYPDGVVHSVINRKVESYNRQTTPYSDDSTTGVVTIKLPYIGNPSVQYGRQISQAVSHCFKTVRLRSIFTTQKVPVRSGKDALPAPANSNIIYFFECHCGSGYVGRTSQILWKRIGQHVPPIIRSPSGRKCKLPKFSSSAVGQHLLENPNCAHHYADSRFSILARARSDYHLAVLEAIFIVSRNPSLCRQKKFVLPLVIFNSLV